MSQKTPNLSINEKMEIILKPSWGYLDVMGYFGVGERIALQVIHELKSEGKQLKFMCNRVCSSDVCAMFGTSREEEIRVLKAASNETII